MYETEANDQTEVATSDLLGRLDGFKNLQERILARTVLPWSEHCTECVWPTCYTTCDLYSPRADGRCRRFVDGMARLEYPESCNGYLIKIRFKQWGKLWTPGNLHLYSPAESRIRERSDYRIGVTINELSLPGAVKKVLVEKRYGWKKRGAQKLKEFGARPTAFMAECYNPSEQDLPLSLTIRSFRKEERIPFQQLVTLAPGFTQIRVPFDDVAAIVDLSQPFNIELIPNHADGEVTLYFGLMDFVQEAPVARVSEPKYIKCVVWDLDNTLWEGTLTEDGASRLRLKPEMISILQTLDQRGVLQSLSSKNNHEQAMQVVRQLEMDHFFLYPQIAWTPKGSGIRTIAKRLNIGLDTVLFVDDSAFERHEVESSCPSVRVLDASRYQTLLRMEELQLPVTSESANRRAMYQVEQNRTEAAVGFKDDYASFLRQCEIKVTVSPLSKENVDRVHELTQRTNQMNFSGNRYQRELLEAILVTSHLTTYVMTCDDRYGSYGIVGFGIVDSREPRLTDLMFSCRIQSKRIEHAFLGFILKSDRALATRDFYANYRKTPRNEPSGQVFTDLGFTELRVDGGVTSLVFPQGQSLVEDGIIGISLLSDGLDVQEAR